MVIISSSNTVGVKSILAIIAGAIIAGLSAFVGGAGAGETVSDPATASGQAVGFGLGCGVVVWALSYFLVLRHERKSIKWIGFLTLAAAGVVGSVFAASL